MRGAGGHHHHHRLTVKTGTATVADSSHDATTTTTTTATTAMAGGGLTRGAMSRTGFRGTTATAGSPVLPKTPQRGVLSSVNHVAGAAGTTPTPPTAAAVAGSTSSFDLGRDPISIFVHTISKCRTEEWRKKVLAMEHLIDELDANAAEFAVQKQTNAGGATATNSDDMEGIIDDNISLSSMTSEISGISSPSVATAGAAGGYGYGGASHRARVRGVAGLQYGNSRPLRSSPGGKQQFASSAASVGGGAVGYYGGGVGSPSYSFSSPRGAKSPRGGTTTAAAAVVNKPLYQQPKELRRLYPAFHQLLNEMRSQVVKSTCVTLEVLSKKTKNHFRFLLKEILPDLLNLHRQTLKVMHSYGENAMLLIWQHTTLKYNQGVNLLVKESRQSKTKEVRCACIKYLGEIIHSWPTTKMGRSSTSPNNSPLAKTGSHFMNDSPSPVMMKRQQGGAQTATLLTESQLQQVTQAFVYGLSDPSSDVRQSSRMALVHSFRIKYPNEWNQWIRSQETTLISSSRIRTALLNYVEEVAAEEAEVANDTGATPPDGIDELLLSSSFGMPPPPTTTVIAATGKTQQQKQERTMFHKGTTQQPQQVHQAEEVAISPMSSIDQDDEFGRKPATKTTTDLHVVTGEENKSNMNDDTVSDLINHRNLFALSPIPPNTPGGVTTANNTRAHLLSSTRPQHRPPPQQRRRPRESSVSMLQRRLTRLSLVAAPPPTATDTKEALPSSKVASAKQTTATSTVTKTDKEKIPGTAQAGQEMKGTDATATPTKTSPLATTTTTTASSPHMPSQAGAVVVSSSSGNSNITDLVNVLNQLDGLYTSMQTLHRVHMEQTEQFLKDERDATEALCLRLNETEKTAAPAGNNNSSNKDDAAYATKVETLIHNTKEKIMQYFELMERGLSVRVELNEQLGDQLDQIASCDDEY